MGTGDLGDGEVEDEGGAGFGMGDAFGGVVTFYVTVGGSSEVGKNERE